jgi:hypothetical protein
VALYIADRVRVAGRRYRSRSLRQSASWARHYDGGAATLPIGWVQTAGIGNLVRSSGHPTTAPLSTLGMELSGDLLDGQLCAAAAERVEKNQLPKLFGAL